VSNQGWMDVTRELPGRYEGALVMGRYSLGERLGSGGFGTVYAGRDERLDREVAVKVIPVHGPAPERGRREALAAARLHHPGIVAVFDAGEDGGGRYLVSELVRGRTLDVLEAEGALSDRDVLRVGLALADALAHAHERGVIHRDVKPQNVIVPDSGDDAAKLTDFGIAHLAGDEPLTMTGDVVGTLAYMAPEQAAGERVDERADVYALALVLYEALAGANPVRAGSPAATARLVGTVLPALRKRRRDLPPALTQALDRALLPAADDRGSLEDLADALAGALPAVSDEGGTIAPHPLEHAPRRLPALSRVAAGLAAGGLVAAALSADVGGQTPELVVAGLAAIAVMLFPRAGWLAVAAGCVIALGGVSNMAAGLAAAAAAVPPLLLRGRGTLWSLPAAAPLLGLAGLAGAYPALAGSVRGVLTRAALGATGLWWLLLAEPLLGRELAIGTAPDAAGAVIEELATGGALLLAPLWAIAAAVLPWLVRGRSLAADIVAATFWATLLGAATAAIAERAELGEPRGLVAGAVVGGAVAIVLARVDSRSRGTVVPGQDRPAGKP